MQLVGYQFYDDGELDRKLAMCPRARLVRVSRRPTTPSVIGGTPAMVSGGTP
jgi:hypothetical protein